MNNNHSSFYSEEIRLKVLKIFKWFIPIMLILNISFILIMVVFHEYGAILNFFLIVIDVLIIAIVTLILYRLDRKDKNLRQMH